MLRKSIFTLTAVFWIFTLFLFYKTEILPGRKLKHPYREFLPSDLVLREEWFGIYFNQKKIGYADFTVGLDDVDAHTEYKMDGEAFVAFPVLGITKKSWVQVKSHIDSEYRLKDFYFSFLAAGLKTEINAKRTGNSEFKLEVKEGNRISKSKIELPEGIVLDSIFGPPKELKHPKVGRKMKFYTFNPLTLKPEQVYLEIISKDKMRFKGKLDNVYLVKAEFLGLESNAWIDEEGRLLKEESPLGISIVRESQMKALAFLSNVKNVSWDLVDVFSLPSNIKLQPSRIKNLTVLLRAKKLDPQKLLDERQTILKVRKLKGEIKEICLKITKDVNEVILKDKRKYLKSDHFIQAQDPKIKALAAYLSRECLDETAGVKNIMNWVYNYLAKKATLSIPSALNALDLRRGDCTEHTFLFAAIARSAGIPTRVKNGLVYMRGRFYYHSWPAVYINKRWIDVDPTLNQFPADPTHIMLVEGELSAQLDILKILGKIEIEVKSYE